MSSHDSGFVSFLQEILPHYNYRWQGFRKVRRQIFKRLKRRMNELGVETIESYSRYLTDHPEEQRQFDALCRIPISRFYRDKGVFRCLENDLLPKLARRALTENSAKIRCWSVGCASGEEPYTLQIIWQLRLAKQYPAVALDVLASDIDPNMLNRARAGCYSQGSIRELPTELLQRAFEQSDETFRVREQFRSAVTFAQQDVRSETPDTKFSLILCRNLAFIYFSQELQQQVLTQLVDCLLPGGYFIIGKHDSLPENHLGLGEHSSQKGIFQKPG